MRTASAGASRGRTGVRKVLQLRFAAGPTGKGRRELVTLIVPLASEATLLWLRVKSCEVDVTGAIYSTGMLLETCHTIKRDTASGHPRAL